MFRFFLIILIILFSLFLLNFAQSNSCGVAKFGSGLIAYGEDAQRGEFPFLVALWNIPRDKFFCGASLITTKHALTASHCIQQKSQLRQMEAGDILALLGRFNFKVKHELGAVQMGIKDIILHEDWNVNVKRYDADIALLFLEEEVQLSEYIQTVCLPPKSATKELTEGQVVGYGASERSNFTAAEDTPRKTAIKAPITNEDCFLDHYDLARISSRRTFCAGGENSGPCVGDSGGGFYVKRNSVWHLQGIVSASLLDQNFKCDTKVPAIYTNVALFIDWIAENVKEMTSMVLPCVYSSITTPYRCDADIQVTADNIALKSTTGDHQADKTNKNVFKLDLNPKPARKRDIHFVPSGIGVLFPNLSFLSIQNCKLKFLKKKNFRRLSKVGTIALADNFIESIDADTFHEAPGLEDLNLARNRLRAIPDELLAQAPNLRFVDFANNFVQEISGEKLFRNNPLLWEINLSNNQLTKVGIFLLSFDEILVADLRNNSCIDAGFGHFSSMAILELQQAIDTKCS